MGMASVQATKERIVDNLLKNDIYLPDSGLVQRLRQQLLRLSKDDLNGLNLIVNLKVDSAAPCATEKPKKPHKPCRHCNDMHGPCDGGWNCPGAY